MPRGMRNFWMVAEADGRKTPATCGPREADGSMFIDLRWLVDGYSESALTILCTILEDGTKQIQVRLRCDKNAITEDTFMHFAPNRVITLENLDREDDSEDEP